MPDEQLKDLMDKLISPKVREAIECIQCALLERSTKIIEGGGDDVDGSIEARALFIQLISAITGQTGNQQSQQQLTQQVGEIVAQLTGRTVTQTTHIADVNTPERIKATVARGVDNNELLSQRLNNIGANVAELASVGLGVIMTSVPLVQAQINAQIANDAAKNSDVGRLVMDVCKAGHSLCVPGSTPTE